ELGATAQLAPNVLAQDHLSRFGRFLDARSRIHAVAVQVAVGAHRDVSQMNADPQIMRATGSGRLLPIRFAQRACAAHSQLGTWEFRKHGITEKLDDSTLISPDYLARKRLKNFD